jgi:hypothetical protein
VFKLRVHWKEEESEPEGQDQHCPSGKYGYFISAAGVAFALPPFLPLWCFFVCFFFA